MYLCVYMYLYYLCIYLCIYWMDVVDTKRGYVGRYNRHLAQQKSGAALSEQRVYGGWELPRCALILILCIPNVGMWVHVNTRSARYKSLKRHCQGAVCFWVIPDVH